MAAPWHCLGAHDGGLFVPGELHQPAQAMSKIPSLHVIGKATKAGVAPGRVGRVRLRVAESPKLFQVQIADLRPPERGSNPVKIKLGVVPGSRNCAHIYQSLHAVRLQKHDEISLRPG